MSKYSSVYKNIKKARWFHAHKLPFISKYYMLKNLMLYNCQISYKATIPDSTVISHYGSGCVINAAVTLGENVMLGHNVTIGNRMPDVKGAPKIGNNVYIGSGAYLGGGITVGDNAKIGAHAVVIKDVPAGATAVGNPARIITH